MRTITAIAVAALAVAATMVHSGHTKGVVERSGQSDFYHPPRPDPECDTCPIAKCIIDTAHTKWDFSNLRPNPCNNKPPLTVLYTGDVVYDLLTAYQSGCGYTYVQVLLPADNGQDQMVGWVDVDALNCHSHGPAPAPAPAAPAPAPAAEEAS